MIVDLRTTAVSELRGVGKVRAAAYETLGSGPSETCCITCRALTKTAVPSGCSRRQSRTGRRAVPFF